MQPHANFGIRVRGCRIISEHKMRSGGKGLTKNTPMSIPSTVDMAIERIPFWKRLYRQGRRG